MTQGTKSCQSCKNDFVVESEDFAFYEKMKVPAPTWCPRCRMVRRTNFRNIRSLYTRTCGLCKKNIITMYHPDDPAPVFCNSCWSSDGWDAMEYAQEIDWSKPFFSQWRELFQKVPRFALWQVQPLENCDYTNYSINNKNCYLAYSVTGCEDIRYSENIDKSNGCLDTLYLTEGNECYENIDCSKNYNSSYIIQSRSCIDSWFLFDCVNCTNCFMSANLRNKQYVFRGEQLSKEEYEKRWNEIDTKKFSVIEALNKEFKTVCERAIHKYADIVASVDSTGNHISNSTNVVNSYGVYECENIKNGMRILKNCKDCHDLYGLADGECIYDCVAVSYQTYNCAFSFLCNTSIANCRYAALCLSSNEIFGCIGMKKASYCILNKQYSKEEYEALLPKIIHSMNDLPYRDKEGRTYGYGEFFPPEFSPFGYNETVAFDLYPEMQEKAMKDGYAWKESEKKDYKITIKADDLSDSLDATENTLTKEIIGCAHEQNCNHQCTNAFKILKDDLEFYRAHKVPLPRLCPNCRHYERLAKREPVELWDRACMCDGATHTHGTSPCATMFKTSYAPNRPEAVYCETCYQEEIV